MKVPVVVSRRNLLYSVLRASFFYGLGKAAFFPAMAWARLFSPVPAVSRSSLFTRHYAMVVFPERCDNCGICVKSCREANGLSVMGQRITILQRGTVEDISPTFAASSFLPSLCSQCSDPPCVGVCPTQASLQDPESGIVSVDRRLCIGCRACMTVCPYMARYYDFELNSVDACDFCSRSRLQKGQLPACVEECPRNVLFFGDLLQEKGPIGRLMEEQRESLWLMRAEKGCRPNLFYASVQAGAEK